MIKVRKAGAWSDVTTYKRRTAGVWEWVDLGKRWSQPPSTRTAVSLLLFPSGDPLDWETVVAASDAYENGTMTVGGGGATPNITGSFAAGNALADDTKYYVEFSIKFTDTGVGGFPGFATLRHHPDGAHPDLNFILELISSDHFLRVRNENTEEAVLFSPVIALNTTYLIAFEWDTSTDTMALFLDDVFIEGITFGAGFNSGPINSLEVGDPNGTYSANKLTVYKSEYGTHTNSVPGGV